MQVPDGPVSALQVPASSDFCVRLGTMRLPLLPHTRVKREEADAGAAGGKGGKAAGKSAGEQELEVRLVVIDVHVGCRGSQCRFSTYTVACASFAGGAPV